MPSEPRAAEARLRFERGANVIEVQGDVADEYTLDKNRDSPRLSSSAELPGVQMKVIKLTDCGGQAGSYWAGSASRDASREGAMSEYFDREYNYEVWHHSAAEFAQFKTITHAGDPAPDFTLPALDGSHVRLSAIRGLPVMIEFGSIT
jgi:hypothetical protein